jgi:hypothetical protein
MGRVNNKSRERVMRIPIPVDDQLQREANVNLANKRKSPVTEANRVLGDWYTLKTGNDPTTGKPI